MENALKVINQLETEGVIGKYAIGGAMAATFYAEPISTFDLDIFIVLPTKGSLLSLETVYARLKELGYSPSGECVDIEGTPVQFLSAYNNLIEEALDNAVLVDYAGVPTKIFGLPYLIAICLQTGRPKDRGRVASLMDVDLAEGQYEILVNLLNRHGLKEKLDEWMNY